MPSGRKDIYKDAKSFKKNDPRINRKGRPANTFKQILLDILEKDGTLKFPKEQVLSISKDGSVTIKMTTDEALVHKLLNLAMVGNSAVNLQAIKEIWERLEGKTPTNVDITSTGEPFKIILQKGAKDG